MSVDDASRARLGSPPRTPPPPQPRPAVSFPPLRFRCRRQGHQAPVLCALDDNKGGTLGARSRPLRVALRRSAQKVLAVGEGRRFTAGSDAGFGEHVRDVGFYGPDAENSSDDLLVRLAIGNSR